MSDFQHEVASELLPPDPRETRLRQIRREAQEKFAPAIAKSQRPEVTAAHSLVPTTYYGLPLLKKPSWTVEIPIYFFVGGAAGAAAIMASVAQITGADPRLTRDARYIAAIGGAISPALLISDLGMPSRFLNMLRVFKIQSPMSVGSWTLMAFSGSAAASAFLSFARTKSRLFAPLRVVENATHFLSAITGAVLSTYTGVLIGATAIPVWNQNAALLPLHFATSGVASAASLLELRGHNAPALNALGIATSLTETIVGASIELRKNPALEPLKRGRSGWLTRLGGLLSGPLPLILRLLSLGANRDRKTQLRKIAAGSAVAGSLITRFAWTQAGSASAGDPTVPLRSDHNATNA